MAGDDALRFLTREEYEIVTAAVDRLIPPIDAHPGGAALGAADYIDGLLGAFTFDPPRIWAGGPFSGRAGGEASFAKFMELSAIETLAWRTRIEGSLGDPEREFNGPVRGLQEIYREGLANLGADFATVSGDEQDRRLDADRAFKQHLYEHACEGAYGPPEYGGNPGAESWRVLQFPGDSQPRGYTDDEVTRADA